MAKKTFKILLELVPIFVMIGLILLITDDYLLAFAYVGVIVVAFFVKRTKNDFPVLVFGFFIMTVTEYLFVGTGIETFERDSFLGIMPLWLPFLWAYGFVVIKRTTGVLNEN